MFCLNSLLIIAANNMECSSKDHRVVQASSPRQGNSPGRSCVFLYF